LDATLQRVLTEIDHDMAAEVAGAFARLVAEYFAETRTGLGRVSTAHAPYLFHARAGVRNWDQGLRSFTCSRRIDALKVWVAIQRYGAASVGALYDHLCSNARLLYEAILDRPGFTALHAPESNILCFRYVGDESLSDDRLDPLNLSLRTAYNREGDGWITSTVLGGRRVLRVTLMNPRTTAGDLVRVLDGLEKLGADLLRKA